MIRRGGGRPSCIPLTRNPYGRPLWSPVGMMSPFGTGQARPLRRLPHRPAGASLVVARWRGVAVRDGTSPSPTSSPTPPRRGDPCGRPLVGCGGSGRDKPVPYVLLRRRLVWATVVVARRHDVAVRDGTSPSPTSSPTPPRRGDPCGRPLVGCGGSGRDKPVPCRLPRRPVGATLVVARWWGVAVRDGTSPSPTSSPTPPRRGDPCGRPLVGCGGSGRDKPVPCRLPHRPVGATLVVARSAVVVARWPVSRCRDGTTPPDRSLGSPSGPSPHRPRTPRPSTALARRFCGADS